MKLALADDPTFFFQILCIFRGFWGLRLQETTVEKKDQLLCLPRDVVFAAQMNSPGNSTMARVSQADLILLGNSQI